nr:putative ribonuclease H-like domain-containing protein [Tanacetum cinerariifolium]GFB43877.1 putative ribonuclease H-like domain-containing protein [Tanacetum cinerariifolium]
FYEKVGIFHQKSSLRTPQQKGVVERRNYILMEAAWTMLIFSKALLFLWEEAIATACYTKNRSLIHTRHNKTSYEPTDSPTIATQIPIILAGTPCSTTIDQDAHSLSHSPSSFALQPPISHQGSAAGSTIIEENLFAHVDNIPFVNVFAPDPSSEA